LRFWVFALGIKSRIYVFLTTYGEKYLILEALGAFIL